MSQGGPQEPQQPMLPAPTAPTHSPFTTARQWLRHPKVRREVKRTIGLIVVVFVFEYFLIPEIATARRSIHLLGQINWPLIVLAVLLEALALFAYEELSRSVFSPYSPSRFRLLRINMSSFALSHVLPGGTAAGGALGYRLLTESQVPGTVAGFGLAAQGVGSAVVLNVIFWVALIFSIPLNGFNPLYGLAALAGAFLLAAFAGTLVLLTRGQRHADGWMRTIANKTPFLDADTISRLTRQVADRVQLLIKNRQLLQTALAWAAANWLLDAASLWVFLWALGDAVSPIDLLVAYGLANILAAIPITPGGVGVIETVLISTLVGFHVPRDIAFVGVLSYRMVNFWLPIPIGGASYLSLRLKRPNPKGSTEPVGLS